MRSFLEKFKKRGSSHSHLLSFYKHSSHANCWKLKSNKLSSSSGKQLSLTNLTYLFHQFNHPLLEKMDKLVIPKSIMQLVITDLALHSIAIIASIHSTIQQLRSLRKDKDTYLCFPNSSQRQIHFS